MMRVYARGRIQDARVFFGECRRLYVAVIAASCNDYPGNARFCGTAQYFTPIIDETVVCEVCAYIN